MPRQKDSLENCILLCSALPYLKLVHTCVCMPLYNLQNTTSDEILIQQTQAIGCLFISIFSQELFIFYVPFTYQEAMKMASFFY